MDTANDLHRPTHARRARQKVCDRYSTWPPGLMLDWAQKACAVSPSESGTRAKVVIQTNKLAREAPEVRVDMRTLCPSCDLPNQPFVRGKLAARSATEFIGR